MFFYHMKNSLGLPLKTAVVCFFIHLVSIFRLWFLFLRNVTKGWYLRGYRVAKGNERVGRPVGKWVWHCFVDGWDESYIFYVSVGIGEKFRDFISYSINSKNNNKKTFCLFQKYVLLVFFKKVLFFHIHKCPQTW